MVKIILLVGNRAVIAYPAHAPALQNAGRSSVNRRSKTHFLKIFHRPFYHRLKTETVPDINRLLFGNILVSHLKANPIAFRVGIRHFLQRFLRKRLQVFPCLSLIIRNILAKIIKVTAVRQIRFYYAKGKIRLRRNHIPDFLLRGLPAVIAHIPV